MDLIDEVIGDLFNRSPCVKPSALPAEALGASNLTTGGSNNAGGSNNVAGGSNNAANGSNPLDEAVSAASVEPPALAVHATDVSDRFDEFDETDTEEEDAMVIWMLGYVPLLPS